MFSGGWLTYRKVGGECRVGSHSRITDCGDVGRRQGNQQFGCQIRVSLENITLNNFMSTERPKTPCNSGGPVRQRLTREIQPARSTLCDFVLIRKGR